MDAASESAFKLSAWPEIIVCFLFFSFSFHAFLSSL
jgi:hypothetical protein